MNTYIDMLRTVYDDMDGVHHYETNEVMFGDAVFVKQGVEVNDEYRVVLPDGVTKTAEESRYQVSNYEYEHFENEKKRQILLPNGTMVDTIVEEFEDLIAYLPSKELDSNGNKWTPLNISQNSSIPKEQYLLVLVELLVLAVVL